MTIEPCWSAAEGTDRVAAGPTQGAALPALALLRWRFANLVARCKALVALRCLAWMRLRRESDILGMTFLLELAAPS